MDRSSNNEGGGFVSSAENDMRQSTTRSVSSATSNSIRSSNQKTLSFFKNLIGKRSTDYHGEAAQITSLGGRGHSGVRFHQSSDTLRSDVPAERANYNNNHPAGTSSEEMLLQQQQQSSSSSCWQSLCNWIGIPANVRQRFFKRVIGSRLWSSTLVLFTTALIFGAQIRDLCPKQVDDFFDILFLILIGFFTVDIVMRMDVEPNYFACRAFGRGNTTVDESTGCMALQVGSFIFWCEVFSTLALLYEVSLINQRDFGQQTVDITLNSFGAPVSTNMVNAVDDCILVCLRPLALLTFLPS